MKSWVWMVPGSASGWTPPLDRCLEHQAGKPLAEDGDDNVIGAMCASFPVWSCRA